MLLFHLVVNPHAVAALAFPAASAWPLPDYIGACGRVHLESYVGEPLSSFIDVISVDIFILICPNLILQANIISTWNKRLHCKTELD